MYDNVLLYYDDIEFIYYFLYTSIIRFSFHQCVCRRNISFLFSLFIMRKGGERIPVTGQGVIRDTAGHDVSRVTRSRSSHRHQAYIGYFTNCPGTV